MNYTWRITDMQHNLSDGLVYDVDYGCFAYYTGSEGEFSSRRLDGMSITGDSSDSGFIPYDDLTENDVVGWVQTNLGSSKVTEIQEACSSSIAANIITAASITSSYGMPWDN